MSRKWITELLSNLNNLEEAEIWKIVKTFPYYSGGYAEKMFSFICEKSAEVTAITSAQRGIKVAF